MTDFYAMRKRTEENKGKKNVKPVVEGKVKENKRSQHKSSYSNIFLPVCESLNIPKPEIEYHFHSSRNWRFDFAWPQQKVFLEIDGGIWTTGGHNRGAQMLKTWEKENEAAILGWRCIRCQPDEVNTFQTAELLKRALGLIKT